MASTAPNATPAVDQTYGQRSVFGGDGYATAPVDEDLDCEDEQEALAYLQLVRNEASKIPNVMVAPRPGPQALPPGYAAAAAAAASAARQPTPQKKKKRRRRHWDEQDDGVEATPYEGSDANANAAKKRRVSRQQAVAIELSYDDEGAGSGAGLSYDDDNGDDSEASSDNDIDYDDNNGDNDDYEPDYSLDHRDLYESSVGDARGYYHDGAYVAAPIDEEAAMGMIGTSGYTNARPNTSYQQQDDNGVGADSEAASAQFRSAYRSRLLLTHFAQMRAVFNSSSSDYDALAVAVAALPANHDTDVGPLSTRSGVFRRWLHLLRTTDPLPAQIAAMDKVSVLRLLRILLRGLLAGGSKSSRSSRAARFARGLAGAGTGSSGNGGLDMTARTSRWLWALFARLPDRGELDYREVGYIRDVAKQAVMRLAHLSYDMAGTDVEGQGDEEAGGEEGPYQEEYGEEAAEAGEGGDGAAAANGAEARSIVGKETRQEDTSKANADEDTMDQDDVSMDMESESGAGESKDAEADGQNDNQAKGEEDNVKDEGADDEDDEMHQRATLEMVLAVAGEFYGQRDLLAFRTPW
ncbi:hypothetical protein SBRCBS47491_000383 [Sporothrix bragantina]|uniref:Uncharacterized protein n=1 Tax=Sporothrix bragantina TaxID=671064 RepID=A0ABP0APV6_9PEZI